MSPSLHLGHRSAAIWRSPTPWRLCRLPVMNWGTYRRRLPYWKHRDVKLSMMIRFQVAAGSGVGVELSWGVCDSVGIREAALLCRVHHSAWIDASALQNSVGIWLHSHTVTIWLHPHTVTCNPPLLSIL